jgi:vacuolar-type H+-ATPase subunit I/STV1
METTRSKELRRAIDEQMQLIRSYVEGFELFVPKDEAALGEIGELLDSAARRVKEIDEARIKRKRLISELNDAFVDLETSQKQFAESVRTDMP